MTDIERIEKLLAQYYRLPASEEQGWILASIAMLLELKLEELKTQHAA